VCHLYDYQVLNFSVLKNNNVLNAKIQELTLMSDIMYFLGRINHGILKNLDYGGGIV
jgi:uncharacterized protein YfkK (UPF0435 family)